MSDTKQSVPDLSERKKFMFYDTGKRQADLKIRLDYDGMNQSQFFRAMITGYLDRDESLLDFLDQYKDTNQVQGQKKRAGNKLFIKAGRQVEKEFALDENEIENIFDIIEKDHPEI